MTFPTFFGDLRIINYLKNFLQHCKMQTQIRQHKNAKQIISLYAYGLIFDDEEETKKRMIKRFKVDCTDFEIDREPTKDMTLEEIKEYLFLKFF